MLEIFHLAAEGDVSAASEVETVRSPKMIRVVNTARSADLLMPASSSIEESRKASGLGSAFKLG